MNLFGVYLVLASILTFRAVRKVPTKMGAVDDFGGSLVLALALGWLIWPLALLAAKKSQGYWSI